MKRFLSISLMALLLVVLAACGGNDNDANNGTNNNDGNNAANGNGGDIVELQWYTIGTPQPDTDVVLEELNEYLAEEIGVHVNMTQIDWGDYEERLRVINSSGDKYDISYTWGGLYTTSAQQGAYLPLNDLIDSHGQALKETINPTLLEGASIDGELYAIPANKEVGVQDVLVFNGNLVEKYDFDVESVETFADLEPMLEVIKENEPSFTPISVSNMFRPVMPFDYVLGWNNPVAFPMTGDTDTVVNLLETDEAMEELKVMRDFYLKGYIPADAASSDDPWPYSVENWFVRVEGYNPYAELLWEREGGYPIVVQPLRPPVANNESVTGSMQAISTTSDHPEKAMEFLTLLNTDPYVRNTLNFGIEGVHFERLDDGKIKDLPARAERYSVPQYTLGNHFILDIFENEPEDKWEAFEEFNESATVSPSLGFHFDQSPVRTQIANIANVASEFMPPLYTGSVDPEEYVPRAIERFNEAGLQDVLDEIQSQYDEWKANIE